MFKTELPQNVMKHLYFKQKYHKGHIIFVLNNIATKCNVKFLYNTAIPQNIT